MIKNFKSFNEDVDNEDQKFIIITEQFYNDFTNDIAYQINDLKYNIKLYKIIRRKDNAIFYRINIVINDYEILNRGNKSDVIRSLIKEFIDEYNKDGKEYTKDIPYFEFKLSTSPYFFSKDQTLLYKKGDDSFDKIELENYLKRLKVKLIDFKNAYDDINELWHDDHNHDIDLNDLLTDEYPFENSFDEVNIGEWIDKSIENINFSLGLIDT
jgi:hypothetical protein